MRQVLEEPTETQLLRKIDAVILRSSDDLQTLRAGEFIATSEGYMSRTQDSRQSLYLRDQENNIKKIYIPSSPKIRKGVLIFEKGDRTAEKLKNTAEIQSVDNYLRSFGL